MIEPRLPNEKELEELKLYLLLENFGKNYCPEQEDEISDLINNSYIAVFQSQEKPVKLMLVRWPQKLMENYVWIDNQIQRINA